MSKKFLSLNPYTERVLREYKFTTPDEISETINRSHLAFKRFSKLSFSERSEKILRLGSLLLKYKTELGTLASSEMGKPIMQSYGEIQKSHDACNYYAMNAENLLKSHSYPISADCYTKYEPMGSIFSIMPFNFPIWMPMKTSIPHLMAGNTFILKHAENVPQTADFLYKLANEAGLGDEFINIRPEISELERIIKDHRIAGVSLTGSVKAGKSVAALAATHMKKFVMELGGNDAFVVLKDADLEKAAKVLVSGRLSGCGQVCISPKRTIVVHDIYQKFLELVNSEIKNWTIGDPLDEKTIFGPMARSDLLETVHLQVTRSVSLGARLLHGGKPSGKYFYPPTLLVDVNEDMPVVTEEVFGPVICILKAKNEADAIKMANNSEYGLGATVFTSNIHRAKAEIVSQIQAGMVFINSVPTSMVQVPFGGIKSSGIGRELGELGIKEFCNSKTVHIS
jgi:succinate-semialdehyde dehydrogenase / glutarate-semialdehyde dehydrogenase